MVGECDAPERLWFELDGFVDAEWKVGGDGGMQSLSKANVQSLILELCRDHSLRKENAGAFY